MREREKERESVSERVREREKERESESERERGRERSYKWDDAVVRNSLPESQRSRIRLHLEKANENLCQLAAPIIGNS